jgi:hypothetical protein
LTPRRSRAQTAPATNQKFTMSGNLPRGHQNIQRNLIEAAGKMPDAEFQLTPTPEMRPFGQSIAHVRLGRAADARLRPCAARSLPRSSC